MRVSPDVLAVLDRATCTGNALSLAHLGQLDRKLYAAVDNVLQAAGGKWNRKAAAHLFDGDAADAIEPILLTGEVTSRRQEFQQFDTPPELAAHVVALADIHPGMFVLEPSAGNGALAIPAADAGADVQCFELDPKRAFALSEIGPGRFDVTCCDFVAVPPAPVNDRVVMNPPYSKRQDIRHVRHAVRFLKPGGRLIAIMAASITFSTVREVAEFRDFLAEHNATVETLPEGSFKASGTSVNTVLVALDMPGGAS
ncbi:type I restriction-modification system methyltransferase subunit-like protein [Methylobacterium nodulans]|uniref:Type I restriction-modification system methyltransferase subunit-like protein n=1 Tax=Methylobacterium nodulans (strain LMG 21967 / CNCM I-2342 / ORS 2060) TaxID=460265 RepID=B8INX5_METNO|nr:type I restriction-modification system methyltransferase subunit-like protein [Methylobacterium nodulans]ACL58491.1 type I restriction-modification system methyltransferase subunit-like protein [Methylobacterium nodulans ORS 2060]